MYCEKAVANLLKGRYEIKESLGQGGMGVVYQAYDEVLKCNVAVKMIRDAPDPMSVELFRRECEVLTGLNHPNIVPILDMGEFEQEGQMRPFFVMPLLPGSTLDRMIKGSGQLTIQRSVDVLTQVCRGLAAAHEKGLVHRDLKPGNIFVMPDDSVEIIDFGVAHMTNTGVTVGQKGTLLFMAPELLENKPPSPLSDIFALGVMAYQMFTRRRPFERRTESEIVEAILHETPPSISDLDPNVNQGISRVVHKAMAKQPWNRFSTARDFADCLQKAYRGEPIEYFDPARIRPRMERAKKAFEQGDFQFASEILLELDAEGHLDPQMSQVRRQIDVAVRQKRVQQLLESARTRLEEDECPLAMQKVQEALALEPESAEALGLKSQIESASSDRQIEGWFRLVRQHIDNSAYSHAREALQNVLQMRPQDTRAKTLLAEVDRQEQDHLRARKEKDGLYHAAVEEFQKGDVSSALGKLEKVLEIDRKVPDRSSTDRAATYQNFYNEVRLEYDSMRNSYAEARKHLDDQNFAKALAICDQFLSKFPGHALFQALKFDVEERQRQRLSSFVAEVDRRVEAEPDLERKENILEEALVQFPQEPHFESALKLIRNRLSLVNSIVSKARFHEERGQFSEALNQWEILKTIHGKYPGLDFEMERLRKRRDQQARGEAKAHWVEKIDRHLEATEFDKALEAVQGALQEFPEDPELLALQKQASQGVERFGEAQQVLAEGNALFERGQFEEGIAALKKARDLDQRNPGIRSALTAKLVERAGQLLESNWRAAADLVDQALELDPGQNAAKSMRMLTEDRRRQEFVDQAVAKIRELQTAGDVAGALAHVEESLSFYPSEPRLKRLQGVLSTAVAENETAHNRAKDLDQARGLASGAQLLTTATQLGELVELISKIASRYPSDAEFQALTEGVRGRYRNAWLRTTAAESETIVIGQPVRPSTSTAASKVPAARVGDGMEPDATGVFILPSPLEPSTKTVVPKVAPVPVGALPVAPVQPVGAAPAATSLVTPVAAPIAPPVTTPPPVPTRATPNNPAPPLPAWLKYGAAAVLLLAVAAVAWLILRPKGGKIVATSNSVPSDITFEVHTIPPDASVLFENRRLGSSNSEFHLPPGQHQLTAEKEGFKPVTFSVDLKPDSSAPYNITLKPLDASFHLFTPFKTGNLYWDAKSSEVLADDGQLAVGALDPGKHTLRIESGATKATISFESQPLALPALERPQASGIDAVAVASFKDQAVLTSSSADLPVLVDNQPAGKLTAGTITLKDLAPGPHTLMIGEWSGNIDAGPAPSLNVFLGSLASQGKLFIDVRGSVNAHVFINGADRGVAKKGRYLVTLDPGDYEVGVSDQGFITPKTQKIQLRKGAGSKLSFIMVPEPVAAPVPVVAPLPAPKLQGTVTVAVSPANAEVRYARNGDSTYQVFRGPSLSLDAGTYIFAAHAPGYVDRRGTVEVTAGGSQTLNLALTLAKVIPAAPTQIVHIMRIEDWDKPWSMDGVWYTRQGGDFVLYKVTPTAGIFRFAIAPKSSKGFLGMGGNPKMRWVMNYSDPKNYILFQIDKQSYSSEEYRNGKKIEHVKRKSHGLTDATSFEIQMTVAPTKISIELRAGENFTTLDEWSNPDSNYTDGRFGFHLPNQDQIYLTNFSFTQKIEAK
jgi:serine/threonine protein kinase/cytochrome c-type biogenesis protein CcmH/NrfG